MNIPPSTSSPGQTIFARLRQAITRVPFPASLKKRKWAVLVAVGLLLAAVFWSQRKPSNEELWAYRMGYGMGQATRESGGTGDPHDLAAGMGIGSAEEDMFEDGFADGRKGRDPRYEGPSAFDHYAQPEIDLPPTMFTNEQAAEFRRSMGRSVEQLPTSSPDSEIPEDHDDRSYSPPSDYALNPMYGEAPPKPEPKKKTQGR